MSCKYNPYGCQRCPKFLRVSEITTDADSMTLIVDSLSDIMKNGDKFCLCVSKAIPEEASGALNVIVDFGGDIKLTLITSQGNFIYADQLRSRRVYHITVATDTEAAVICRRELCRTNHVFPEVAPTPPPTKRKEK